MHEILTTNIGNLFSQNTGKPVTTMAMVDATKQAELIVIVALQSGV